METIWATILVKSCKTLVLYHNQYPIQFHPLPILEPLIESPRQVAVDLASSTQALDDKERDLIDAFIFKGCGCKQGCSSSFDKDYYTKTRSECVELTHRELDLFVMGKVSATVFDSVDAGVMSRHKPHPRQRLKTFFQHHSHKVFSNTQTLKSSSCF